METITDLSQRKAENGEVWMIEDHLRLIQHLRKIDELAQAVYAVVNHGESVKAPHK